MNRPAHKELFGKIKQAIKAVSNGRIALLNTLAIAADAIELEYVVEYELKSVLSGLLEDTTPAHYTGSRPPKKSYEQDIQGLELFAFSVESRRFTCRVYFKFALEGETFWLVSLHRDRPNKEAP